MERIKFASLDAKTPAQRRREQAAEKPCAVCGRTTAQAEAIDYACCRDAGQGSV